MTSVRTVLLFGAVGLWASGAPSELIFPENFERGDPCAWSFVSGFSGTVTFYLDLDSDQFGDDTSTIQAAGCVPPVGYALHGGDCDDTDGAVNPGAEDLSCSDGDRNCDGLECTAEDICDNSIDDDADGVIDCADPDCAAFPACGGPEICDNGKDDDGDGFVDCEDPDCAAFPGCGSPEICDNGKDDDGDGFVDCEDSDCAAFPGCGSPEVCDNGKDDDGDGFVDCEDPDCAVFPGCLP